MNSSIINEINILSQDHTIDEFDIRESNNQQQHHAGPPRHQYLGTMKQIEGDYQENDI